VVKKLKIGLGIAVGILLFNTGWQIAACEIENTELQDDMRDFSSQLGGRIGFSDFRTDEQLRDDVLRKADRYDLPVTRDQITIYRDSEGKDAHIYIAADYTVPIYVPGFSFAMHFTPHSGEKPF